jgi:phosphoketolase
MSESAVIFKLFFLSIMLRHFDNVPLRPWQWASNDQSAAEPDVVMACCGDTPTLEILATVSILREHLPDLKIRVINVVDLMKLQSESELSSGSNLAAVK